MSCTGPCNQGRDRCPAPAACELDIDDAPHDLMIVVGVLCVISLALIVLGFGVWVMYA